MTQTPDELRQRANRPKVSDLIAILLLITACQDYEELRLAAQRVVYPLSEAGVEEIIADAERATADRPARSSRSNSGSSEIWDPFL